MLCPGNKWDDHKGQGRDKRRTDPARLMPGKAQQMRRCYRSKRASVITGDELPEGGGGGGGMGVLIGPARSRYDRATPTFGTSLVADHLCLLGEPSRSSLGPIPGRPVLLTVSACLHQQPSPGSARMVRTIQTSL